MVRNIKQQIRSVTVSHQQLCLQKALEICKDKKSMPRAS
jgi:hypothetical protein